MDENRPAAIRKSLPSLLLRQGLILRHRCKMMPPSTSGSCRERNRNDESQTSLFCKLSVAVHYLLPARTRDRPKVGDDTRGCRTHPGRAARVLFSGTECAHTDA